MAEHGLPGRLSAWRSTAPDTGPTARRGAAKCWLPDTRGSSVWRRCGRFRSPEATRRSAIPGASRWHSSRMRSRETRRSTTWRSSIGFLPRDIAVIGQLLAAQVRAPLAHGAGRYFDGIGSLVLARPDSRYEGQIALEWNGVAEPSERGRYGYELDYRHSPCEIDFRQMTRDVVRDVQAGTHASTISAARFTTRSLRRTAEAVRAAAGIHGALPVVLTGGCFQNARLAEALKRELRAEFTVTCIARCRQATAASRSARPSPRRRSRSSR